MKKCLRAGGRVCTQAESVWLHLDLIKGMIANANSLYDSSEYATTQGIVKHHHHHAHPHDQLRFLASVPTYPGGQIGFLLAALQTTDEHDCSCSSPVRVDEELCSSLRYYTPQLHKAAFVLPRFAHQELY